MASALQGIEYKVQHKREEVHPAPLPPSSPQIIVIGALGVGKTSLLMRYIHGQFQDRLSRFVAEEKKSVVVDGKEVHLKIWDTAGRPLPHQAHPCTCPSPLSPGQERYQSITNRFYGDTHGVVIVYDIVQEETWSDVDFWVRELQYYLTRELEDGMPVLFVGNKKDLVDRNDEEQKTVNFRQVQEVANAYGFLPPIEVSAKTGHSVDKAFTRLVKQLLKRTHEKERGPSRVEPRPPPRKCCLLM